MEIMLNKAFRGSWGEDSTDNIPHEIINLFKSDNGNLYIYIPPYGGYNTGEHKINEVLFTGEWANGKTEVLYKVLFDKNDVEVWDEEAGLKPIRPSGWLGGKQDKDGHERPKLAKYIKDNHITYGGKQLDKIRMSALKNDKIKVFYFTFKAKNVVRPKKRMFIDWSGKDGVYETDDQITINLSKDYKYQRQYGYVSDAKNQKDYEVLLSAIENPKYWQKDGFATEVDLNDLNKKDFNFLKLIHKEYDEVIFSNLFYEYFSADKKLFNEFVKEVLNIPADDYEIKKEVQTLNGKGRIDLVAVGEKNYAVIENKISSGLNGLNKELELSQLTTYIEDTKSPKRNEAKNKDHHFFLFLPNHNDVSIAKYDKKQGEQFKKIHYDKIWRFFLKHRADLNKLPVVGKYADDFIDALELHTKNLSEVMREETKMRFLKVLGSRKESL